MSNYNKATNFAVKDTLSSGDPDKIVSGAEIDNEFNAISSAVNSKLDSSEFESGLSELSTFPSGGIVMWSGAIGNIPLGWTICDGTDGTPDLRDRFIVGAGSTYLPDDTGGSKDAVVVSHSHSGSTSTDGLHSHSGSTNVEGNHRHQSGVQYNQGNSQDSAVYGRHGGQSISDINVASGSTAFADINRAALTDFEGSHSHSINTDNSGSHSHSFNTDNEGESGTNKNLPPYYALAFIMKL